MSKDNHLKEQVIQSFEMEVESLTSDTTALRKELGRCHSIMHSTESPVELIDTLQNENTRLTTQVGQSQKTAAQLQRLADELTKKHDIVNLALSETKEKLALSLVSYSQTNGVDIPKTILQKLHDTWKVLGLSIVKREEFQKQIENCLVNTCTRIFEEAERSRKSAIQDLANLRQLLNMMRSSLALSSEKEHEVSGIPLLQQLDEIQKEHREVKPKYLVAIARRHTLVQKATELCFALGMSKESLGDELQTLMAESEQTATDDSWTLSTNLSEDFLTHCDSLISKLRLNKSTILSDNSRLQRSTYALATEMDLKDSEIKSLVVQNLLRKLSSMPSWWSNDSADAVSRSVLTEGGVVRSSRTFSQHLSVFHEALTEIARPRRSLSEKLRGLIEHTQKTLLKTVDGEFEANEAYFKFHESLFRLPPLSKDHITACMSEIEVLTTGVDAMVQSEIEALTVVWEALNVSMVNRGQFWDRIDRALCNIESTPVGPLDNIVQTYRNSSEEWIIASINDGTKAFSDLETRLFRLETIYEEVEQLRSRQDSKSKILSLDSEVRMLSAQLNEFEDKKCSKNRLTTKKNTSSTLLKEERFRKQMQSKFTAKLDQLVSLLKDWKSCESTTFDHNLLSEDVRTLLKNSDRNEFMHLRTVEYKSSTKRDAASLRTSSGNSSPPRKRQAISTRPNAEVKNPFMRETISTKRNVSSNITANPVQRTDGEARRKRVLSPVKCEATEGTGGNNLFRPSSIAPQSNMDMKGKSDRKQRLTLDPFGSVLEKALSPLPADKENPLNSA